MPKAKKVFYKTWYGIALIIICFIVVVNSLSKGIQKVAESPAATPAPEAQATPSEPTISKAQAQKELDSIMALAKKSNLVTSYEFSDSASVVYVGSTWYTQTVQQKKDFIAYVGERKKVIIGYSHFELHDAYTNEKVGEITAFSSSIEVYK